MENSEPKKPVKFHLELKFNKKEKMKKFKVDYYIILTIGIDIFEFDVNIISDIGFTIILYLFLLHFLLEGEY